MPLFLAECRVRLRGGFHASSSALTTSTRTVFRRVAQGQRPRGGAPFLIFSGEERPHFSAVSFIYILTFLGSPGQGGSLQINSRIQVLVRVGGTPRTWEREPGLASALEAQVSGGVLRARRPRPEFLRRLERSPQPSDCSTAAPAGSGHPRKRTEREAGPGLSPRQEPGSAGKPTPRAACDHPGLRCTPPAARGPPRRPPASRGGRGAAAPAAARPPGLQEGGARPARRSRVLPPPRRGLHGALPPPAPRPCFPDSEVSAGPAAATRNAARGGGAGRGARETRA